MEAAVIVTRNIIWTILPFFIGWIVYILKNSKVNLDRLVFIVKKADEIVEWIEAEFPQLPYIEKIDKVIDILIKALEDAGYQVGSREELERAAKAAYNRYKQRKALLEKLFQDKGIDTDADADAQINSFDQYL